MTHSITSNQKGKSATQTANKIQKFEAIQPKRRLFKSLFLATIMLALFQTPVLANNVANLVSIHSSLNTTFTLHLPNASQSSSHMILRDSDGLVVHDEKIKRGVEHRMFNLKNLPDGEYILSVAYDSTTNWEHIFVQDGSLRLEKDLKTITSPAIMLNDSKLDLNMLCFADAKVSVSIWDESGQLLSKEYFDANGNIQRRYNLEELEEGDYYISVSLNKALIDFEFEKLIHWNPETAK